MTDQHFTNPDEQDDLDIALFLLGRFLAREDYGRIRDWAQALIDKYGHGPLSDEEMRKFIDNEY